MAYIFKTFIIVDFVIIIIIIILVGLGFFNYWNID